MEQDEAEKQEEAELAEQSELQPQSEPPLRKRKAEDEVDSDDSDDDKDEAEDNEDSMPEPAQLIVRRTTTSPNSRIAPKKVMRFEAVKIDEEEKEDKDGEEKYIDENKEEEEEKIEEDELFKDEEQNDEPEDESRPSASSDVSENPNQQSEPSEHVQSETGARIEQCRIREFFEHQPLKRRYSTGVQKSPEPDARSDTCSKELDVDTRIEQKTGPDSDQGSSRAETEDAASPEAAPVEQEVPKPQLPQESQKPVERPQLVPEHQSKQRERLQSEQKGLQEPSEGREKRARSDEPQQPEQPHPSQSSHSAQQRPQRPQPYQLVMPRQPQPEQQVMPQLRPQQVAEQPDVHSENEKPAPQLLLRLQPQPEAQENQQAQEQQRMVQMPQQLQPFPQLHDLDLDLPPRPQHLLMAQPPQPQQQMHQPQLPPPQFQQPQLPQVPQQQFFQPQQQPPMLQQVQRNYDYVTGAGFQPPVRPQERPQQPQPMQQLMEAPPPPSAAYHPGMSRWDSTIDAVQCKPHKFGVICRNRDCEKYTICTMFHNGVVTCNHCGTQTIVRRARNGMRWVIETRCEDIQEVPCGALDPTCRNCGERGYFRAAQNYIRLPSYFIPRQTTSQAGASDEATPPMGNSPLFPNNNIQQQNPFIQQHAPQPGPSHYNPPMQYNMGGPSTSMAQQIPPAANVKNSFPKPQLNSMARPYQSGYIYPVCGQGGPVGMQNPNQPGPSHM